MKVDTVRMYEGMPRKGEISVQESPSTVLEEIRTLEALSRDKLASLTDPEEISEKWERVERLKAHIERFLVRAAASNTVLGGALAGILAGIGEKNPAAIVAAVALALDLGAFVVGARVEKDAAKAEEGLKTRRLNLSQKKLA